MLYALVIQKFINLMLKRILISFQIALQVSFYAVVGVLLSFCAVAAPTTELKG